MLPDRQRVRSVGRATKHPKIVQPTNKMVEPSGIEPLTS